MAAYAVLGSETPLGARVVTALHAGAPGVAVAVEGRAGAEIDAGGCLLTLISGPCPSPAPGGPATRLAQLRHALDGAAAAGATRVVHLSSAVVYGAATDNPVPLPEDAPVRPDAAFAWATELAEAERLVAEWRDGATGRSAAVLRPALVVAPEDDGFLARALGGLSGPRPAGEVRPVQFVHVDDVATAVVVCATAAEAVDGTLNVAPDGWVDDEEAAALAGAVLAPPALPARLVRPARRLLWGLGLGATPPGAESYATGPWVVAAERLPALGWQPTHSSAEAVVATTHASALATLSPRRRQELLLGAAGALGLAALAAAVVVVVKTVRRGGRRG